MFKKEIRVLGIDDSPFNKQSQTVLVVAALYRGGQFLDGVLSTYVAVDGNDSTSRLTGMINKCKFKSQLQTIFLDGIALGGFNVVDIDKLSKNTKIPVIVIMRNYPNLDKIKKALIEIKQGDKIRLLQKAGIITGYNKIFFQAMGTTIERAKQLIDIAATHSNIPEPLRVAHLIGSGIINGESKGRA